MKAQTNRNFGITPLLVKISFTNKILIVVNLLAAGILTIVAFISIKISDDAANKALHQKAKTMLAFLQKSTVTPIWNMDNGFLEVLATELETDTDFSKIGFFDKKNESLLKNFTKTESPYEVEGDVIAEKGEKIGHIVISYNDQEIQKNSKKTKAIIRGRTHKSGILTSHKYCPA